MNNLNSISVTAYFKRVIKEGEKQSLVAFTSFRNISKDKVITFDFTCNVNNGLIKHMNEKTPVLINGELSVTQTKKSGRWVTYTSVYARELIPFVNVNGLNKIFIQGNLTDGLETKVMPDGQHFTMVLLQTIVNSIQTKK